MTQLGATLWQTWRDSIGVAGPWSVDTDTRRAELRPNALGGQALLLRLVNTTSGDYVDAIIQRGMLEDADAATMLQQTLDTLEAELCEA